jgi:hypothetical protein
LYHVIIVNSYLDNRGRLFPLPFLFPLLSFQLSLANEGIFAVLAGAL